MKKVLISVFDKKDLVPFARGLKRLGFEIIATKGTAGALEKGNISVRPVSEITGFREILAGRVKTLHPAIFGGVLALRNREHLQELSRENIGPIDLVVINLHPFKKNLPGMDIGGAALIRAAVKNLQNVGVVIDPGDYRKVLAELKKGRGRLSSKSKKDLAGKAFGYILDYDKRIYEYLRSPKSKVQGPMSKVQGPSAHLAKTDGRTKVRSPELPGELYLNCEKAQDLRYGENPHQRAALYRKSQIANRRSPIAKQLWGKELSFNNILDLDAASSIVNKFRQPAAVVIKHTGPCGAARDKSLIKAYQKARACDPLSAFGGVSGLNKRVDVPAAREITSAFIEAVIAPGFTPQALKILKKKKNLRIVQCPSAHLVKTDRRTEVQSREEELRTVDWGILVQDRDLRDIKTKDLRIVTRKRPTKEELRAILFAWKVVKYVKSNAIVISNQNQTLGIGAGQPSRIDSVKIAISKMQSHIPHPTAHIPIVLASDGFFPFRDSVDEMAKAKISALVQPGGSIRDKEVIKACNEHNIAMVFTGIRHFRH